MRCCVVLAALLVCAALAVSHTTPLFVWSGAQLVREQPARQSLSPFSLADLSACLASEATPYRRQCSLFAPGAEAPELQLVFLTPELSVTSIAQLSGAYGAQPSGGALRNLERFQEQAASAVALPYASLGNDAAMLTAALTALLRYDLAAGATSVVAADEGDGGAPGLARQSTHACSVADLPAWLAAHPELFANRVTDVVIVLLRGGSADAVAAADAVMGSIVDSVAAATAGNYVAVFTGLSASVPASLPAQPSVHRVRDGMWGMLLEGSSNSSTGNHTCNATRGECDNHGYWPPEVLASIIAAGLLAAVLLGAIQMTADVQTPERFETPAKGQAHKQ